MATETLRPAGVGDSSQNTPNGDTPNWKCVDETPSDGDTTTVRNNSGAGATQLDLYTIEASLIPVGSTINSVTVHSNDRSTSIVYRGFFRNALKKSGGTTQYGAENAPSTTYIEYSDVFTGIVQGDLAALQIGIEMVPGGPDLLENYWPTRCTQVWVVIDYTSPAAAARGDGLTWIVAIFKGTIPANPRKLLNHETPIL